MNEVNNMKIINIGLMADKDYQLSLEYEDGTWELFEDYINRYVEKKFQEMKESYENK